MATDAQIAANRLNAQKSTGPRTEEGKQTVSQNAVKHGLLCQAPTLAGEDPDEFGAFLSDTVADLKAVGIAQQSLAERIAHLQWKLKRLPHIEAALINERSAKEAENRNVCRPKKLEPLPGPTTTEVMLDLFRHSEMLDCMQVYEQRLDRSVRALSKELREMQKHQQKMDELAREDAERARDRETTRACHFSGKPSTRDESSEEKMNKQTQFPGSDAENRDLRSSGEAEIEPRSHEEHEAERNPFNQSSSKEQIDEPTRIAS